MTLRLTVDDAAWRAHVDGLIAAVEGLLPVVKGNGYGFGRARLAALAAGWSPTVCVGTVHELDAVPPGIEAIVLTPALDPPAGTAVLTVGTVADVAALGHARRRVVLKLQSSMRRFGASPEEFPVLLAAAARHEVLGAAIHLPLAGDDGARLAEVEGWLPLLSDDLPLTVSHLAPAAFAALRADHPGRQFHLRMGTALWHGDKSFLHLQADVLATHAVRAGGVAGYRHTTLAVDGTVVVVGAGSAHGVSVLAGGLSPFHFARRRLLLLEPPHMHNSMAVVPAGEPAPNVGDWVDVQQPMINVHADEVIFE